MKKFVLKNSETRFQKAETRFLNAETRFKTPKLPCPAFSLQGLNWIPQKKACLHGLQKQTLKKACRRLFVYLSVQTRVVFIQKKSTVINVSRPGNSRSRNFVFHIIKCGGGGPVAFFQLSRHV